jgi:hypothetical protein
MLNAEWLDDPPRTFLARCKRCGQLWHNADGGLIAEVQGLLRRQPRNVVLASGYAVDLTKQTSHSR